MAPTLVSGQLAQMRPLGSRECSRGLRGQIIAFRHPADTGKVYVKRIVGLPGEYVTLEDGWVSIEGQPLREPYISDGMQGATRSAGATQWLNDADEFWVLGDNRQDSEDSRVFGPVSRRLILGKVWFRYWPPARL